jgi:uncharacterized caspase-like protein
VGLDSVELRSDLKVADMRRAPRDFIDKSRGADVTVVYYAGHGIEVRAGSGNLNKTISGISA